MVGITIVEEEVEMVGMDLVGRGVLYRYMRWYRQKRLCLIILLKVFFFYYILFLFLRDVYNSNFFTIVISFAAYLAKTKPIC